MASRCGREEVEIARGEVERARGGVESRREADERARQREAEAMSAKMLEEAQRRAASASATPHARL